MPHVPIGALAEAAAAEAAAAHGGQQRCLIIEFGKVSGLQNLATQRGAPPAIYLVAEVGKQQLLCQPILPMGGEVPPDAAFQERFVVFVDGDAEQAARGGKLQIKLRLVNKQVEPLDDDDLARHVTNPRFGLRRSKDASVILQPHSELRRFLSSTFSNETLAAHRETVHVPAVRQRASLIQAILQVVFASFLCRISARAHECRIPLRSKLRPGQQFRR